MKRSETVLVYGVTGILVVILGIAVVFGNDPVAVARTGEDGQAGSGLASSDLASLLDPDLLDTGLQNLVPGEGEEPQAGSSQAGQVDDPFGLEPGAGTQALGPVPDGGKSSEFVLAPNSSPLEVALSMRPPPTVDSLFGPSQVQVVAGEARYRVVTVARGDSFSALVERWCGSAKTYIDDAVALNEQLDINRLRVDQQIWLPWVEDQLLIEAYQERAASGRQLGASGTQLATGSAMRPGPVAAGNEHVVQPGESLWAIAVKNVSSRQAKSYIEEILTLNPKITDPARVHPGMKIILPASGN